MNRLGRELLEQEDPPVKVLFVYNCNAVATMPDQERVLAGLARDDLFTVVYEQVDNDTVPWADVVLPATAMLEHAELSSGYGAMVVQHHGPVTAPAGEARPNYEVFAELCDRLELTRSDDPVGPDALAAAILGSNGYSDTLAAEGIAPAACGTRPVQMVDVVPRTADQKIHLVPASLDAETDGNFYGYRDDPATEAYPLALISPASGKMITSTFGQTIRRQWAMHVHPDDAAPRGIEDGDRVRMFNELGEVHVLVKVTDRVRAGVVFLPKGLWSHHTLNGRTTNALCSDAPTDCGEGATFNDARVQVERLEA